MSHQQKTSYNNLLAEYIRSVQANHPELTSFSATVRYLVVVGLAAEHARIAAMGHVVQNPFLYPQKELMEP